MAIADGGTASNECLRVMFGDSVAVEEKHREKELGIIMCIEYYGDGMDCRGVKTFQLLSAFNFIVCLRAPSLVASLKL